MLAIQGKKKTVNQSNRIKNTHGTTEYPFP